jgi:hypothetical protein
MRPGRPDCRIAAGKPTFAGYQGKVGPYDWSVT